MTAPKKKLADGPVLPKKNQMEKEAEKHVYPKNDGEYNIHMDEKGFFERDVDRDGIEIEYVPLPKDLPPSVRKRLEAERKGKK
jgi:hypothetical protein